MQPLSFFEMFWQLGIGCLIALPVLLAVAVVIFLLFKPLEWLDKLSD